MARKKNSEVSEGSSIVVAHSMKQELVPNLGLIASRLGLSSRSEILTMIASNVEASVAAMRPLADARNRRRAAEETLKAQHKEHMRKLRDMNSSELAKLIALAEPDKE